MASPSALTHVGPTGVFLHQVSFWAGLTVRDLVFARDLVAPTIAFTAPLDGTAVNTASPQLLLGYSDLGAGVDPATLALTASGAALAVSCPAPTATGASCTPAGPLADGAYALVATVKDRAGNLSQPAESTSPSTR